MTKTKIIRFRNHESNMRTCVKLLIIFWNSEKSSGVKGIVLPSKCPFNFLYILCPRDPRGLYIYIYSMVLLDFIWFLWNMQRYKLLILLSSSRLVTVVFFKNLSNKSCVLLREVHFGDICFSTSVGLEKTDVIIILSGRTLFSQDIDNTLLNWR